MLGVVTLFSTGEILINQLNKDLRRDKLAMIRMQVIANSTEPIDNETYLDTVRQQPGVTDAEGRAVYPFFWKKEGAEKFRKGYIVAHLQPYGQESLEPVRLIKGSYPADGQHQIAIEQRMADEYGLGVGDKVDVRILGQGENAAATSADIQQETWEISGILFQPYGERGGPNGFVPPKDAAFATYEDARTIGGFNGINAIYVRYHDFPTAEKEASHLEEVVAQNTPFVPVFTFVENPAKNSTIESTRSTNRVLITLAMVALVVSGFLVINVINSIVVEQKRQIGVMKSLGATQGDNILIYSGIALAYGIIGVIPGVLLGVPMGYWAAKGLATQNNTVINQFAVSPRGILIGVLVGLAVPVLASLVPVLNGTRVRVREAMTDFGISSTYGRGPLASLIKALPMPLTLRQAANNVNQKKLRLALTGTTLTIAIGAFMGIYATFSSLSSLIDDIFGTFGSQITISPTESQDYAAVKNLLVDVPGIKAADPSGSLAIEIEGYSPPPVTTGPPGMFAIGIDPTNPDIMNFDLQSGDAWTKDPSLDGVVLSSRIAAGIGKKAGDSVVVRVGGNRAELPIVGVATYPFDTVWMRWDRLARLGGLTTGGPQPNTYSTTAGISGYDGSLPDGQITVIGMDEHTGDFLTFVDGQGFTPGQPQVIISQAAADNGGYQVGDTLTVTAANGTSGDFTITGIVELPPQLTSSANAPQDVMAMFWRDLAAFEGRDLSGDPAPNSISIMMADSNPTAKEANKLIDQINDVLLANGISAEYTNWVEFNDIISQYILAFQVILYLAAGLIAAVGALGLLTSLSMSVFERQKEIGVMRSVGASSGAVTFQFLVEGIIVGVVAWAIGIPISYLLSKGLLQALNFGDVFNISYPPETVIVGLVGTLLVVTVASLWPSLAAARKTVSDILRYQ